MAKYSKFTDDYKVKTFRWPYWLLPLLFLSLILVLGLFIFITIHSADRFGCLFHCESKIDDGGVEAPKDVPFASRRGDVSTKKPPGTDSDVVMMDSTSATPTVETQNKTGQKDMITVTGKLLFPSGREPDSIPPRSYLIVRFEDSSLQDAASEVLGKTVVDPSSIYKKGEDLTYKIECAKPKNFHDFYSVSATLNMGWTPKPGSSAWLKHGDFFTDTMYTIKLKNNVTKYEKDITFAYSD